MSATVESLWRHPIKAVGRERLPRVALEAGRAVPGDRAWAVAHEAAKFGTVPDGWAHKVNFLRGVTGPELMAIEAETRGSTIVLRHPRAGEIAVDPATEGAALVAWLAPLWPEGSPRPAALVRVAGVAMTDVPEPWVALHGTASLRALEGRAGVALSPHRFRGNVWIDGLAPWEEFEWIGRCVRVGGATFEVRERITRCKATMANPETGRRDVDTLGLLDAGWGHTDFGVYAAVVEGGTVAAGDAVEVS